MGRRRRGEALDRERIEAAAFAHIDRVGVGEFSLRGLASELGVEPMSLYHWYPSKAHLLDALLVDVVQRIEVPGEGTWDERLAGAARSYRVAVRAHPGFASYFLLHRFNLRAGLAFLDRLLGVFVEAGFDGLALAAHFRFLGHWLTGFCLDECSGFGKGPSAAEPVPDEEVGRDFPNVARLGPYNKAEHFDALFEAGLRLAIEGLKRARA